MAQWRQLVRRQFCGKLHVITPQQVQCKPPLRQAAGTLYAICGQCVEQEGYPKKSRKFEKNLKNQDDRKNEQFAKFVLQCSLRSHRKTSPTPKNG